LAPPNSQIFFLFLKQKISVFKAKLNAERLQRIWEEEQSAAAESGRQASFAKCILKFGRTR
jgi:hypothetical protein